MHKLLEQAMAISDQAELFSCDAVTKSVIFDNGKLRDIDTKIQSGMSLRIIKDNKLGFAYTKNLRNRKELLDNCLVSLKGRVEANFDLPFTKTIPKLKTYSSSLSTLSNRNLVDECKRICELISSKVKGQCNITASDVIEKVRIINSAGTDIKMRTSEYAVVVAIVYPNSYAAMHRTFAGKAFEEIQGKDLMMLIDYMFGQ